MIITVTIPETTNFPARFLAAAQNMGYTTIQAAMQAVMENVLVSYEVNQAITTAETNQTTTTKSDLVANPLVVQ